jgi:uncharacterized protein (TIRG00374 family)
MKKSVLNILKFIIFLGAGLFLFWLIYKDQEIDVLKEHIEHIDYTWLVLALLCGGLSHVVRAVRWQMLVKPYGYMPKFSNSFFAVMITYFANLAVPRLGEVARPSILLKYEKIPFSTSFGTIVLERAIDLLILLVLTLILFLTQTHVFVDFAQNNPDVASNLADIKNSTWLYVLLSVMALGFVSVLLLWKRIKQTGIYKKFENVIEQFLDGIRSIRKLKSKGLFIFYTLLIWLLYFLMTYLPVYAFESTSHLTVLAGLTFFIIGSYGMVVPSPGGLGAWHFMVAGTLVVLGINDQDARSFALIVHTAQTALIVVLGFATTVLLPIVNRKA